MFIYGLYAIESHKCDMNNLGNCCGLASDLVYKDKVKIFQRQKSYSVCTEADNKIDINESRIKLHFQNYNSNSIVAKSSNLSKYEMNLHKFEFYIETLNKIAEQDKLERFLNQTIESNKNLKKRGNSLTICSSSTFKNLNVMNRLPVVANPKQVDKQVQRKKSIVKQISLDTNVNNKINQNKLSADNRSYDIIYRKDSLQKLSVAEKRPISKTNIVIVNSNEGFYDRKLVNSNANINLNTSNGALTNTGTNNSKTNSKKWLSKILNRFKRSQSTV